MRKLYCIQYAGHWEEYLKTPKDKHYVNFYNRRDVHYLQNRKNKKLFTITILMFLKTELIGNYVLLMNGNHQRRTSVSHNCCYLLWIHSEQKY